MNVIISTCKGRSEHLRDALPSWRDCLPGWLPLVVAVDDPAAASLVREVCRGREFGLVEISQVGFSRLGAIAAAVERLPFDAQSVVIFDADLVALLHTESWLAGDWSNAFQIVGPAPNGSFCRDDFGVIVSSAKVFRAAFELLGDISDWTGYGWEDVLLRAACWYVTNGAVKKSPARWAHIPHSDEMRRQASSGGESIRAQALANYRRLRVGLEHLSEVSGVRWEATTLWEDCVSWARPAA